MILRALSFGCHGHDVQRIQQFLAGLGLFEGEADGYFEQLTQAAVATYRKERKLPAGDIVDQPALATMIHDGLDVILDINRERPQAADWLTPKTKTRQREYGWGRFDWTPATAGHGIVVDPDWIQHNTEELPAPKNFPALAPDRAGPIRLHKLVIADFIALLEDIVAAGLDTHILTFDGGLQFRFMRGSRQRLSAHCWGIAFDINSKWNRLGCTPAYAGQKGSVREIVPLANRRNFWWSGHSRFRRDGAHFEHCQPKRP